MVGLLCMDEHGRVFCKEQPNTEPDIPSPIKQGTIPCTETCKPFPYFDDVDEALAFLRGHRNQWCEVEHGAADDVVIYSRQDHC
jgi:hypothetical protein